MLKLSIYKQAFLMEIRRAMAYRFDFIVNFFGQTLFKLMLSYFLWKSIFTYQNVELINGYSFQAIVLYYLIVSIIFKIQNTGSIGAIANEIYQGSLNKYLLYPVNFLGFKLAAHMANAFIYTLQLGCVILAYHLFIADIDYMRVLRVFPLFILSIALSSICYYILNALCELVAFWADNVWSLGVMLRFFVSFFGGVMIPLSFFPQWSIDILQYTPFPYLVEFSMKIFNEQLNFVQLISGFTLQVFWISFFSFLCRYTWRKGRYKYTGVGI